MVGEEGGEGNHKTQNKIAADIVSVLICSITNTQKSECPPPFATEPHFTHTMKEQDQQQSFI